LGGSRFEFDFFLKSISGIHQHTMTTYTVASMCTLTHSQKPSNTHGYICTYVHTCIQFIEIHTNIYQYRQHN
jgi:hypothetical protein